MRSKTKMVFYEQTCSSCDFLKIQGSFPCETRYERRKGSSAGI